MTHSVGDKTQDAAASVDTAYMISVGEGFEGVLADKSDEDRTRVELVEGRNYDIKLRGIGPDADTDTVLRIYNQAGEQVGFHDDVDCAAGMVNSRLMFSPEVTATYYLSVGAFTGNPIQDNSGRYQLAVYDVDADPLSLVGTDRSDYYLHTRLIGGAGDDELDGGRGWDWLEGGPRQSDCEVSDFEKIAITCFSGGMIMRKQDRRSKFLISQTCLALPITTCWSVTRMQTGCGVITVMIRWMARKAMTCCTAVLTVGMTYW